MPDLDDMVNDLDGQPKDAEWRRRSEGKLKPKKNAQDEKVHQELKAQKAEFKEKSKEKLAEAEKEAKRLARNDERRIRGKLKKLGLTERQLEKALEYKEERQAAKKKKSEKEYDDREKRAREIIEADLEEEVEKRPGVKFRMLDIRGPGGEGVEPFWKRKKIREGTDNGGRKKADVG